MRDPNAEVKDIWNHNAEWWDERMEEGNVFHNVLNGPAIERLLDLRPGEIILDCACGNGQLSRRMAQLGAQVVAFDFSDKFLARAKARTTENVERIDYKLIDATNEDQLMSLGHGRFDAATCSMALMDMAEIEPLIAAIQQLLKPGGRFVFSILHPCFNSSSGYKMVVEEEDREGILVRDFSIKTSRYITPTAVKGVGIVGQPVAQIYFHRPLNVLLNTFFRNGFALDGMEEPVFQGMKDSSNPLSWANFEEIPPLLIARMHLAHF